MVQSFNPLKVVFPGRITRSRKDPEVREAPVPAPDSERQGTLVSHSHAVPEREASSGDGIAAEESSTSQRSAPAFEESRIRKFQNILAPQIVDLTALQEVRRACIIQTELFSNERHQQCPPTTCVRPLHTRPHAPGTPVCWYFLCPHSTCTVSTPGKGFAACRKQSACSTRVRAVKMRPTL